MDIFKWRVAYRVGDNDVDEQHRQIFQMLAELHRDIHRGDARDHIRVCLKRLLSYTQSHFGTEEALMKRVGYPEYEAHKQLHADLIDEVWRLYQEVGRSNRDLGLELLAFLNDWLIEHILGEDKKISAYVNGA